ncbi:unnamed protein product [marine sediment metagenome]|uniref:Uncharacterized protein n=1 Tax=marine sediment metagenome TaxID=412755 RepID=X1P242_9ZZZZ
MANIELRVRTYGILPGSQMVEVWRDGVFMAGIYPQEDGLRIESKYMDGVKQETGYPPAVVVCLSRVS